MKKTRKLLALLLALVMALTAFCVSAFAAKKQYHAYTFFGDSVTAAAGLPSYYTFYKQDPVTGKWEGPARPWLLCGPRRAGRRHQQRPGKLLQRIAQRLADFGSP